MEAIRCARQPVKQIEDDWERRIGADELANLKRVLRALIASLDEHADVT